ncbi:MAG TPA: hypothetical protein VFD37_04500 [Solirubrobacterales bacterium]|nr:hypothetical protein [Solirubrobacterales bacterium]
MSSGGGGPEHRGGVDDLLDRARHQPQLTRERDRALEGQALHAVKEQAGAELDQRGGVVAGVIQRQADRHLPAQVIAKALHRLLIRRPLAVGEQEDLGQVARRDRGPAQAL